MSSSENENSVLPTSLLSVKVQSILDNNVVLNQMISRRSIREYTDEPITDDELKAIIDAIERGPNWCNFQHVSIISVEDEALRKEAVKLCGNQVQVKEAPVFLMFCADFYRTWIACNCSEEAFDEVTQVTDNIIVGATEVGIALGSATVAAESLGLGTCCIGAAREHGPEMAKLLGLPKFVFPVCGFCIGHAAATPDLKPRLPESAVFFKNQYDPELKEQIQAYDKAYHEYLANRSSGKKDGTWSGEVSAYYTIPYTRYGEIPEMLKNEGF